MRKAIMRAVRDSIPFAFIQGLCEHWNGCGGRTHPVSDDWNSAHDKGMNFADKLRRRDA